MCTTNGSSISCLDVGRTPQESLDTFLEKKRYQKMLFRKKQWQKNFFPKKVWSKNYAFSKKGNQKH
jgi:hypothetical protein